MKKIIDLAKKHKTIILYFLFGIISTAVNIITYWVMTKYAGFTTVPANIVAWTSAVIIAFFTNKFFVFKPGKTSFWRFFYEFFTFVASRAFTGLLDTAIMYLFVEYWGIVNDVLMKVLSNIIVIILNYVLAKCLTFAKKRSDEEDKNERDLTEKGD